MEISADDIKKAQREASKKAIALNEALGLEYYIVKKGMLIKVDAQGKEHPIRKAVFGSRPVDKKHMKLKNGQ